MRFSAEDYRKKRRSAPLVGEGLFDLLNRILGLVALGFAIVAMARLIGFPGLTPSRFDLMPVEWRAATTTLTILYAAAGFGLWQLTRWGFVVWVAACAIQILMHTVFVQYFGPNRQLIVIIALLLIVYNIFGSYVYISRRKRALAKH